MEMVSFNILYENDTNDVDIICVPDTIANEMHILAQMFLDWLPNAEDEMYWSTENNRRISVCETDGFIKWLNENYCRSIPKVYVVTQHTQFHKEYDVIEF